MCKISFDSIHRKSHVNQRSHGHRAAAVVLIDRRWHEATEEGGFDRVTPCPGERRHLETDRETKKAKITIISAVADKGEGGLDAVTNVTSLGAFTPVSPVR